MKIAIEKRIPYIMDALLKQEDILLLDASEFNQETLRNVDVIIVRTTVLCNATLLDKTPVKLILTATIGHDHIDTQYCDSKGIIWKNAPGCNANAVVQYFLSTIAILQNNTLDQPSNTTVGIIGHGNVGSKIAEICQKIGFKTLINDPPLQSKSKQNANTNWATLEQIAQNANIITIHTPLTKQGEHPTHHLINQQFIKKCTQKPLIINAARGGIVEEKALIEALQNGTIAQTAIDCWENEPNINTTLLNASDIHTPHIAGYSADGKANATRICLQNLQTYGYKHIDINKIKIQKPTNPTITLKNQPIGQQIATALLHTYNILEDSNKLALQPKQFKQHRDQYSFRREANAYTIYTESNQTARILQQIGFNTKLTNP